jgi:hypothetical protein
MSPTWLPDTAVVALAILAMVGLGTVAGWVHDWTRHHLDRGLDRRVLERLRRQALEGTSEIWVGPRR